MFKFKVNIIEQTENGGTKDAEIMVLLKYLSNFWRILEIPLIDYEWSRKRILAAGNAAN